jgi:hypothetical protein
MSSLRFLSSAEKMQYYYSCEIKCKLDNRLVTEKVKHDRPCTGEWKDCTNFGGYDPSDPCKQTCIQKEEKDERNIKN